ncbi:hypothetical protein ACFYU9_10125 [Streptomyces sp. NPDC004327]|uniref:hypothetical protein n=1 Tax=Streptomyces sp. NPDC004327 TaxID=3364699 RepID=UPI00368ED788
MSGSLWLKQPTTGDALPAIPRQRTDSALPPDPLDALAARLDALAAVAVHPDEIAAILESDGMTDDHIRLTYGRADSFALAEDLYARTERRHPDPEAPAAGPWHTGLAGCLLRGLVFALPGLAYVLGAPILATGPGRYGLPPGSVPLFAGAVTGWVWNQALAHRAYGWLGLGDRPAAVRALLTGAPAGALAGAAVAVAAAAPGEGAAALFGAGQAVYLAAATVLLVLGRERALLAALLPLAGAVPAFRHDLPQPLRAALLLCSLATTTTFAAAALGRGSGRDGGGGFSVLRRRLGRARGGGVSVLGRGSGRRDGGGGSSALRRGLGRRDGGGGWSVLGRGPGRPAGRRGSPAPRPGPRGAGAGGRAVTGAGHGRRARGGPPFAASLPYGLFGLGSGLLVLGVGADAVIALSLSMGPAEWLLHRFRGASLTRLRLLTTAREFRRAVTGMLVRCLGGYLVLLLALTVTAGALWPGAAAASAGRTGALLLVGAVLWLGLLLQAFGAVSSAAVVCLLAAVARALAPAAGAAAAGLAAAVLCVLTCVLLVRPTAHRS